MCAFLVETALNVIKPADNLRVISMAERKRFPKLGSVRCQISKIVELPKYM